MPLQLTIKSAAQNVDDFKVDCEMTWTVKEIKNEICRLHPNKPEKDAQKLIYGGKLLPDHLALSSILNQTQDIHVLHLVCPIPARTTISSPSQSPSHGLPAFAAAPINSNPISSSTSGFSSLDGNFVQTSVDPFSQYMAMQQMYAHMWAQYASQYSGSPGSSMFNAQPMTAQQLNAAPHQQNTDPPIRRERERRETDVVDYLYICIRWGVMAVILYNYSSVYRILSALIVFLFLRLFTKLNRRRQEIENIRRQIEEDRQFQNDEQPAEVDEVLENAEEEEDEEPLQPDLANQRQNQAFVPSRVLELLVSFFTSLAPPEQVPVN